MVVSENDLRGCHERWWELAYTFCDCFIGDRQKATAAAQDAFEAFLSDSSETDGTDVPLKLLQYAMGHALDQEKRDGEMPAGNELEQTIPRLPAAERAVFILRGVLGLSPYEVALVGRTTSDEVNRLWTASLLRLRGMWHISSRDKVQRELR